MVDGDTRLDDDVAGRGWVSYVTERVGGIGERGLKCRRRASWPTRDPAT